MSADDPPRRRPGRPRVDEPGARLSTFVRQGDYDRLVRLALKEDRSVAALVRELLNLKLR
jgi:hypothetical protein